MKKKMPPAVDADVLLERDSEGFAGLKREWWLAVGLRKFWDAATASDHQRFIVDVMGGACG